MLRGHPGPAGRADLSPGAAEQALVEGGAWQHLPPCPENVSQATGRLWPQPSSSPASLLWSSWDMVSSMVPGPSAGPISHTRCQGLCGIFSSHAHPPAPALCLTTASPDYTFCKHHHAPNETSMLNMQRGRSFTNIWGKTILRGGRPFWALQDR